MSHLLYINAKVLAILFLSLSNLAIAAHFSIPLKRHHEDQTSLEHRLKGLSLRASATDLSNNNNNNFDHLRFGPHDWWYANFNVGESRNLALSIDTASGSLFLNNGLYRPSEESLDLNETERAGFGTWLANGCGSGYFHYDVFKDTISIGDLTVKNQSFGTLVEKPPAYDLPPFPGDGIMGMSVGTDFFSGHGTGWFENLCDGGGIPHCRFGMALGTSETGAFVFGGIDETLYEGDLTPVGAPSYGGNATSHWRANIVINEKELVIPHRNIALFDSGTANILMPPSDAKDIFEAAGIQTVEVEPPWGNCTEAYAGGKIVLGYYPCDNPPKVGLHLLNPKDGSIRGPVFNIEPEAFKMHDNGNNNCTATIVGLPSQKHRGSKSWNVGNAWMRGKYTDYTSWGVLQGVALLKNKADPGGWVPVSSDASRSWQSGVGVLAITVVIMLMQIL